MRLYLYIIGKISHRAYTAPFPLKLHGEEHARVKGFEKINEDEDARAGKAPHPRSWQPPFASIRAVCVDRRADAHFCYGMLASGSFCSELPDCLFGTFHHTSKAW